MRKIGEYGHLRKNPLGLSSVYGDLIMGEHPANIADLSPQERALIAELRSSGKSLEDMMGDAVEKRLAKIGLDKIDPNSQIAIAAASGKDAVSKSLAHTASGMSHPFVIGFLIFFFSIPVIWILLTFTSTP